MHRRNFYLSVFYTNNHVFHVSDESIIVFCWGYLGISTVTQPPPMQRFSLGCDNLKKYFIWPFQVWYVGIYGQCHVHYCFVTLTFNFKVTGGHLKVRLWPFFDILAQFSYTES